MTMIVESKEAIHNQGQKQIFLKKSDEIPPSNVLPTRRKCFAEI
jgi:hypothetical protein